MTLDGTNQLLLVDVGQVMAGSQRTVPDALDKTVKERLVRRLGEKRRIQFYLPTYASWNGTRLLIAVGGETHTENVGSLRTYCYGFLVDTSTLQVKAVMSEQELKSRSGHGCRVSP